LIGVLVRTLGPKAVLAVAVVGGLLAGCSSGSGDNGSSRSKNTSSGDRNLVSGASEGPSVAPSAVAAGMGAGSAEDGEFPRTVGHFEGKTEIKSAPKKIAALSTGQLDDARVVTVGTMPRVSVTGVSPSSCTGAPRPSSPSSCCSSRA
jgi:iron complex transport system substrate-binding protein